jgi:hypothetical protein
MRGQLSGKQCCKILSHFLFLKNCAQFYLDPEPEPEPKLFPALLKRHCVEFYHTSYGIIYIILSLVTFCHSKFVTFLVINLVFEFFEVDFYAISYVLKMTCSFFSSYLRPLLKRTVEKIILSKSRKPWKKR